MRPRPVQVLSRFFGSRYFIATVPLPLSAPCRRGREYRNRAGSPCRSASDVTPSAPHSVSRSSAARSALPYLPARRTTSCPIRYFSPWQLAFHSSVVPCMANAVDGQKLQWRFSHTNAQAMLAWVQIPQKGVAPEGGERPLCEHRHRSDPEDDKPTRDASDR